MFQQEPLIRAVSLVYTDSYPMTFTPSRQNCCLTPHHFNLERCVDLGMDFHYDWEGPQALNWLRQFYFPLVNFYRKLLAEGICNFLGRYRTKQFTAFPTRAVTATT